MKHPGRLFTLSPMQMFLSVGLALWCAGLVLPPLEAFSLPTPEIATLPSERNPMVMEDRQPKTWPAFDSANPRQVCVRVTNSGSQDMTVWLLHSDSVVGLFTVLPHRISAICSLADKIEMGCTGESCDFTWAVFDEP